jgi:hypothetical protein
MLDVYRAVVLLVLVGCYSPSYSNCSIACTDSCPNSLTCDSQLHVCRASGTTCGGDASVGSDATGDMDARNDGPKDAPADAPGGCMFVQEVSGALNGPNLVIDLSPTNGGTPIAQGDLVVLTLAGRGAGNISTVNDFNGHQFTRAIQSQVTSSGVNTTSAIYYTLAAPVAMSMVNVAWTADVTQVVVGAEWHCDAPATGLARTGMTMGQGTGSTTDTGDLMPTTRAIVIASLAGASNISSLQTPTVTLIDQISIGGGPQGAMTNIAAQGVVEGGTDIDVTFNTNTGVPFAGTAAAFSVQ